MTTPFNKSLFGAACLGFSLALSIPGCSNFNFPGVYRIDIPQGNIIEEDMLNQLTVGMTKAQVRYVMGSPMIADTFHPERWDYFYSLKKGDGTYNSEKLILTFQDDRLGNIERVKQAPTQLAN